MIFLKCVLLYKTSKALTVIELKRRARTTSTKHDQALYKLLAFQTSLSIIIWLLGAISGAALFIIAAHVSGWLVLALAVMVSWLLLDDRSSVRPHSWLWSVSGFIAQIVLPLINFVQPVFGRIANQLSQPSLHTGVYEKEDLLQLLTRQKTQIDNRISETELKAARGALKFGDKLVSSIMIPRKAVTWVSGDETIGPKVMDDLHKTSHIRFPVIDSKSKPANPEVVGTLYLRDLLRNLQKPGKISDIMKKDAHFINESDNLLQALDGFLKAGQHLLIVVNNFEEVAGVLTLEDVLGEVLGQKIADEFDDYNDRRAVAGHEAEKTHSEHTEAKVE